MNKCYIIYPQVLKIFYIAKALEKKGFEIVGLDLYDDDLTILKQSSKLQKFFMKKSMTNKDFENFYKLKSIFLRGRRNENKVNYLESIAKISIKDFHSEDGDKLLCFEERFMFESSMLDKNFIHPRYALLYSCKHMMYNLLKREYYKIYTEKDFDKVPEGKYIFKPSIDSVGKRNVFILEHRKDYKKILEYDPEIFSFTNRVFILEKYIEHVSEIWAMTLFDCNGKPYILWFSTEKNHATFSVFEKDLYKKIEEINSKLKIKKWMAYIQFLVDEKGKLHFVDLNPRLPGDDDWHELLYRYLTGKSFAKIIVDLIIDGKIPNIVKTKKYVKEDEYDSSNPIQKNQRVWDYPDNYKQKPLLTFKKLDI